ncbi:MAG: hypothetical protein IKM31_05050 [Oscillospiraceae bacterium]|nr:hypothetical protein [Oscillospiraceae bacterium]
MRILKVLSSKSTLSRVWDSVPTADKKRHPQMAQNKTQNKVQNQAPNKWKKPLTSGSPEADLPVGLRVPPIPPRNKKRPP